MKNGCGVGIRAIGEPTGIRGRLHGSAEREAGAVNGDRQIGTEFRAQIDRQRHTLTAEMRYELAKAKEQRTAILDSRDSGRFPLIATGQRTVPAVVETADGGRSKQ